MDEIARGGNQLKGAVLLSLYLQGSIVWNNLHRLENIDIFCG